MPLWAALVGVLTALVAAMLTARAASINAQRTQIQEKFQGVRQDLARFQAIQNYVDVQGYGGEMPTGLDMEAIRAENFRKFFTQYAEETANARAALARINVREGEIWAVVTSPTAQITSAEIAPLWARLDDAERDELSQLERWWLPNPMKS